MAEYNQKISAAEALERVQIKRELTKNNIPYNKLECTPHLKELLTEVRQMGIPLLVESKNGHDELDVPKEKLEGEVKKQLKDGKWVTVEKEDGSTEVLTEKDLPKEEELDEEDKKLMAEAKKTDWKDTFKKDSSTQFKPVGTPPTRSSANFSKKFEKVTSATSTGKVRGG